MGGPVDAASPWGEAMDRAIELARPTRPHPNPRVGAVVVDPAGLTAATGVHHGPGTPHAEAQALAAVGGRAPGGTLVVNLEPCDHHGRTPPCTEAIIASGIARVVVGTVDPDPQVSGRGIARLRAAGIEVEVGVRAEEVEALDPGYLHHRRTGLPRVVHKAAATLDGQTGAIDGSSQWITSEQARADAHRLRMASDAVMVGAGTLLSDDPLLTVRVDGYAGPQPRPVVVAGSRPLPASARIWDRRPLVLAPVQLPGVGDVIVAPGAPGRVDLRAGLEALAGLGLLDILVEGGAILGAALLEAGLIERGVWYLAGLVAGGVGRGVFDRPFATLADARRVEIIEVRPLGPDLRVEWRPVRPPG